MRERLIIQGAVHEEGRRFVVRSDQPHGLVREEYLPIERLAAVPQRSTAAKTDLYRSKGEGRTRL